jgi:hypothetical protein
MYALVACRPELDDGLRAPEGSLQRVLKYRILIIIPAKDILLILF